MTVSQILILQVSLCSYLRVKMVYSLTVPNVEALGLCVRNDGVENPHLSLKFSFHYWCSHFYFAVLGSLGLDPVSWVYVRFLFIPCIRSIIWLYFSSLLLSPLVFSIFSPLLPTVSSSLFPHLVSSLLYQVCLELLSPCLFLCLVSVTVFVYFSVSVKSAISISCFTLTAYVPVSAIVSTVCP